MNVYTFACVVLLCVALVCAKKDCPIITGEAIGEIACFPSESFQQMVPEGKEDLAMYMPLHDVPGFEPFLSKASAYYVPEGVEPSSKCPVDRNTLQRLLEEFESRGSPASASHGRKLIVIKKRKERSKARCFCIKPCQVFAQLGCDSDDKHCMCD
ncbi:hypothetical protein BSKO_02352 [Bryopsis sp. KO-2023]|nr:hypothetical protein BSKO_02352 [Bryopsis sp. KO-2023]